VFTVFIAFLFNVLYLFWHFYILRTFCFSLSSYSSMLVNSIGGWWVCLRCTYFIRWRHY